LSRILEEHGRSAAVLLDGGVVGELEAVAALL
jgi:hypothetical protein